jgi:hypothetical protein
MSKNERLKKLKAGLVFLVSYINASRGESFTSSSCCSKAVTAVINMPFSFNECNITFHTHQCLKLLQILLVEVFIVLLWTSSKNNC